MKLPENTPVFEAEIATYWFENDGILYSKSKSPTRTLENIKRNIEFVKSITNNKKVCLLVYLTPSGKPNKTTRDYVAEQLPNIYSAMAIVSKSGLGKMVMNFIFKLNKPTIPMKTFSNKEDAKQWLSQYL